MKSGGLGNTSLVPVGSFPFLLFSSRWIGGVCGDVFSLSFVDGVGSVGMILIVMVGVIVVVRIVVKILVVVSESADDENGDGKTGGSETGRRQ